MSRLARWKKCGRKLPHGVLFADNVEQHFTPLKTSNFVRVADMETYEYGRPISNTEYNGVHYLVSVGFPRGTLQRAGVKVSYDNGETWHSTDHPAIRLTGRYSVDKEWGESNLAAYIRHEGQSDKMHSCYVGRHWECESRTVAPGAVCGCRCHQ